MATLRQHVLMVSALAAVATAMAVTFACRYELARAVGMRRQIDIQLHADHGAERIPQLEVYLAGVISNPFRTFLAVHEVHQYFGRYRPDSRGRVRVEVPYYPSYKVEVHLPVEGAASAIRLPIYTNWLYRWPSSVGEFDGSVSAELNLSEDAMRAYGY